MFPNLPHEQRKNLEIYKGKIENTVYIKEWHFKVVKPWIPTSSIQFYYIYQNLQLSLLDLCNGI